MRQIKMYFLISVLINIILSEFLSGQPLNGNYTIDLGNPTSGTNYNSFTDAVSDLHSRGVSGPVVFDVKGGTYTEQIELNTITGASATDFVTFTSSEIVNLGYTATSSADNWVIKLFSTAYIKFENLNFYAYGTGWATIVELGNFSTVHHIVFTNNEFNSNSSNYNGIIYCQMGDLDYIEIDGNTFYDGGAGINLATYSFQNHFYIINNYFFDPNTGIILDGFNSANIYGNAIANAESMGMYFNWCYGPLEISRNIITNWGTFDGFVGIIFNYMDGSSSDIVEVNNNIVQSSYVGILVRDSDYIQIYHNSINIDNNSHTGWLASRALQIESSSNINVVNNILINNRDGYAYDALTGAVGNSNYNNIFTSGSNYAIWDGAYYSTLTALQTASGKDINSVSVDVDFVSYWDLHLDGSSIGDNNLAGFPLSEVTIDFDAETRNTFAPYIGADENLAFPLPVELSSFTVKVVNNTIQINWRTETEVNNYGFDIERSNNDKEWKKIGFVEGHGNSNSPKEYSFIDDNLVEEGTYYRLKQIDTDGAFEYSDVVEVLIDKPTAFSLEQNYPNPFNPTTTIKYQIPNTGFVTLRVYDVLGNKVATLVNERKEEGRYQITFNASALSSGVYIYQIRSGDFIDSKKMILMK